MDNKAISSDLIRGHIDTIILYSLVDGDKHAQQISDAITQKSENAYQINQATLYSSLKRLESLKYVSAYWHNAETGRRRYFKLTVAGQQTIDENLSNWSYSRNVIDKLMNLEPSNVQTAQAPQVYPVYIPAKTEEKPVIKEEPVVQVAVQPEKQVVLEEKPKEIEQIIEQPKGPEKNFRLVLADLIKTTEKQKPEATELSPIIKEEKPVTIDDVIPKFNDTIKMDTPINTGNKIDFDDIVLKGEKEGYKVSVSSKQKNVKIGSLYINKVKLFASLFTFLLGLIEFFIISLTCKTILSLNFVSTLLSILFIASYPVIQTIIYFKNPSKTSVKLSKDIILNCAIVVFNVILFTVVINLLAETDLTNTFNLIVYALVPFLICVNAVFYYVCKYFISTKQNFIHHK